MFMDPVLNNFSNGWTKFTYLLNEAVGSHFQKITLEEIRNSYNVVEFDGTTNSESKKELQVRIRFWFEKMNQAVEGHLKTFSYAMPLQRI